MASNVAATPADAARNDERYRNPLARIRSALRWRIQVDGFDLAFLILLVFSAFLYHQNSSYWSGQATIGNWQYGDAEFWWNGAIQLAKGIVRENPNLTFRMGYAFVGGLWIALFGTKFALFHAFLLVLHIVAWYALYLALRPSLGKLAAATGVLLAVLNPFTAEWLAISTSDSVGLLFNVWALVFLLVGLRGNLSPVCLAGSGLFVSFASLTRPLMTPFLVLAVLLPLFAIHVGWRRRARAAGALLVAFLIPTLLWMGLLRSLTNEWKLAGSDAATFYAASNPQIQVWNPEMFVPVEGLAKARFKVTQVSPSQVDQEFWILTSENYRHFTGYHLRRIVPHIVELAGMSIAKASRVSTGAILVRLAVLCLFALGLAISRLGGNAPGRCSLALMIVFAWMYLPLSSWVVLLALVCGIPIALWNKSGWGIAVLASYWFAGVGALYLVGGTWGPPLSPVMALNALGYRLGGQFFFAADFIVLYLIRNICMFRAFESAAPDNSWLVTNRFWSTPPRWASTAFLAVFVIWFGFVCSEVTAGAAVVGYRWASRSIQKPKPFPDLTAVMTSCLRQLQRLLPSPRLQIAVDEGSAVLQQNEDSPYVLTTGASTDFVWNLAGQNRTKVLFSLQSRMAPFDFANRRFTDFPISLDEPEWAERQGAWLLRRFKDDPAPSNLPWYLNDIAVRAFFPLKNKGSSFDVTESRWFPVIKYASQMHAARELTIENGTFENSGTSGMEHYPRRFALRASTTPNIGSPAILIDTERARGTRNLKFQWQCELSSGELPRKIRLLIQRYEPVSKGSVKPMERPEEFVAVTTIPPMRTVSLDLSSPPAGRLRLQFDGLRPGEVVWIYELNITAEDWDW